MTHLLFMFGKLQAQNSPFESLFPCILPKILKYTNVCVQTLWKTPLYILKMFFVPLFIGEISKSNCLPIYKHKIVKCAMVLNMRKVYMCVR
ncbi:hypothetical protein FKM82_011869 [Ascaphus truei]